MRPLPPWLTSMADCGAATVWPLEKAPGWLTAVRSVMVTDSEPCATAAGDTRTAEPITTVPVRELTMTLAAASPGLSSMFSSAAT